MSYKKPKTKKRYFTSKEGKQILVDDFKEFILVQLTNFHVGADKAITLEDFGAQCEDYFKISFHNTKGEYRYRELRGYIGELENDIHTADPPKVMIGSAQCGYFIVQDREEALLSCKNLLVTFLGTLKRYQLRKKVMNKIHYRTEADTPLFSDVDDAELPDFELTIKIIEELKMMLKPTKKEGKKDATV